MTDQLCPGKFPGSGVCALLIPHVSASFQLMPDLVTLGVVSSGDPSIEVQPGEAENAHPEGKLALWGSMYRICDLNSQVMETAAVSRTSVDKS